MILSIMELKFLKMEQHILVTLIRPNIMVMENANGQKDIYIRVTGLMEIWKAMVNINGQIVPGMLECGKITK